jgi:hypothetical protein
MEAKLKKSNWRSKTKRATSLRGAYHNGWKNARSLSKEKGDAAIQIKCLRLAPNHWALATMQHPRGGKIMTSKRRKLPNQRSCFLFRIEGYGSCRRGDIETIHATHS